MAATVTSTFIYPLVDFTSLSGNPVNKAVLAQEIADDATITLTPQVTAQGTDIRIDLAGNATAAMKTQLDVLVAAHTGGNFSAVPQTEFSEANASDDTGGEVEKSSLTTGILPAGAYLIGWYMEVKTTDLTGTPGAVAVLNVAKNGGSSAQRGMHTNNMDEWQSFSGSIATTFADGDNYEFQLAYQRTGASGNAAMVRRARLTVVRIG